MSEEQLQRTVTEPWGVQQPFITDVLNRARAQVNTLNPYYGGRTYVDFTPQTEVAMGLRQARALGGSPYEQAGQHYLANALGQGQINMGEVAGTAQNMMHPLGASQRHMMQSFQYSPYGYQGLANTAQGGMLGANPYLSSMFNRAAQDVSRNFQESVMPGLNATFGGAGRTGSGAHQQALSRAGGELGRQLTGMATDIYGGAYGQERGLQQAAQQSLAGYGQQGASALQQGAQHGVDALSQMYGNIDQSRARAMAFAPQMQAMEYGNLDQLASVGSGLQQQARNILQDDMDRFNYYRDLPRQNLADYATLVTPQYGQATTLYGRGSNRGGQVLGGVLSGAGMGGQVAGPWGAMAGGILGGVMGGMY